MFHTGILYSLFNIGLLYSMYTIGFYGTLLYAFTWMLKANVLDYLIATSTIIHLEVNDNYCRYLVYNIIRVYMCYNKLHRTAPKFAPR